MDLDLDLNWELNWIELNWIENWTWLERQVQLIPGASPNTVWTTNRMQKNKLIC